MMNSEIENQEKMKKKAWAVCKEFLCGPWENVSLEDFGFSKVSGGFSNTLYRCTLPQNVAEPSKSPREALFRIYGVVQEDPNALVAEAVTFMLLSERNLGPRLYGLFPGGRLEEFIPSHNLGSEEMKKYSQLTAREFAKIHTLDVPVRKVPDILQNTITKWLSEVQECLQDDNGKHFMSYDEYKEELDWLEREMPKTNSPVVFCHNDLQGGNILCHDEEVAQIGNPKLTLIDFEFGAYNYRDYDFANHFCERCFDYDCTSDYAYFQMDLNKFPSKEEQTEFFIAYFDQLSKEGITLKRAVREELEVMLSAIPLFACACHLLASVWCAKMVSVASTGFAYEEFGRTRTELYRTFKEKYQMSK